MCCKHCENDFNPEEDIIVDTCGALRSVLMDIGDVLINLCKGLDVEEIKSRFLTTTIPEIQCSRRK